MFGNTMELTKNVMERCDELMLYSKRLFIENAVNAESIGSIDEDSKLDKLLQRRES